MPMKPITGVRLSSEESLRCPYLFLIEDIADPSLQMLRKNVIIDISVALGGS